MQKPKAFLFHLCFLYTAKTKIRTEICAISATDHRSLGSIDFSRSTFFEKLSTKFEVAGWKLGTKQNQFQQFCPDHLSRMTGMGG